MRRKTIMLRTSLLALLSLFFSVSAAAQGIAVGASGSRSGSSSPVDITVTISNGDGNTTVYLGVVKWRDGSGNDLGSDTLGDSLEVLTTKAPRTASAAILR